MARKNQVGLWAMLILAIGARGAVAADKTPLFGAFKHFCADTGARGDNVKAAVLAAGGAPHDPPTRSVETPFFMRTSLWDIKVGGLALVVAAGEARTGGTDARAMNDCVVSGREVDAASLQALAGWAGVPANPDANDRITYYVFEDKSGAHQTISDSKAAEAEGRVWRLSVIRGPGVASVELMHLLGRGQ